VPIELFVVPNLDRRHDEDRGQGWKEDRGRNPAEQLSANEAPHDRTCCHDQNKTQVLAENDEAAIPAVANEADNHRRQAHGKRQAAGKLMLKGVMRSAWTAIGWPA
jgi:hypothetical protein